jgi:hypothetical protein
MIVVIASQFANGVMMMQNGGYTVEAYINWVKFRSRGDTCPRTGTIVLDKNDEVR